MKFLRLVLSGLLFACASVCMAQDSSPGAEAAGFGLSTAEKAKTIRTQYVNSEQLPDGIAFVTTIGAIKSINDEDPTTAEALVMLRMGLGLDSAREIIALMLTALEEFDSAVRNRTESIGCDQGVPRAVGEQVFSLLESTDDARNELATEHLVVFQGKLDVETAARFQQWLQLRKRNVVHVDFNHKELAKLSGKTNVDTEMSALCSRLWQEARGTR